jgi:hypothetical protein
MVDFNRKNAKRAALNYAAALENKRTGIGYEPCERHVRALLLEETGAEGKRTRRDGSRLHRTPSGRLAYSENAVSAWLNWAREVRENA